MTKNEMIALVAAIRYSLRDQVDDDDTASATTAVNIFLPERKGRPRMGDDIIAARVMAHLPIEAEEGERLRDAVRRVLRKAYGTAHGSEKLATVVNDLIQTGRVYHNVEKRRLEAVERSTASVENDDE